LSQIILNLRPCECPSPANGVANDALDWTDRAMLGHDPPTYSLDPYVFSQLGGGPTSVDQQRRAGGKFRCVGSKVKDGSRDFFAGAEPTHRVQR